MPPSWPAAPFLFPFPIILEQILPVPCQMDSIFPKHITAGMKWERSCGLQSLWCFACATVCPGEALDFWVQSLFRWTVLYKDCVCGFCTNSWLLLQYEPELGAEQSCSWSYPGRDFLSRWKVGCGPHLCGHIEGGVLGVFNQKRVCICFLNSSVGLWALQWGHGQELFPAPWTSWLHQLCRTWTLTAPSPPAQLLSSSQILRGLKLIYVNGWWPCNAQWTSFLWAGKYVVLKRVGIFFSPFLFSSLLSFGKMR